MVFVRAFALGAALGVAAVTGWVFGDRAADVVTRAYGRYAGPS